MRFLALQGRFTYFALTYTSRRAQVRKRRNIAILGSTGSIGRNSLEVIANFPDHFRVVYLTAHRNIQLLQEQIRHHRPAGVVVRDECNASVIRKFADGSTEVLVGEDGLNEIVRRDNVDMVISSLVGFAGVKPTLAAVEAGKDVALANKETLVVAGSSSCGPCGSGERNLLPVDSEHSAILQCLQGEQVSTVERIILTAREGPFLHLEQDKFETITVAGRAETPHLEKWGVRSPSIRQH